MIVSNEIDVAAATIDLAGAEMALSTQIGRERALERALKPAQDSYDYILIDTPPSLGLLTINALAASDGVIVPVQCEYLSLRGLLQLERTLEMIRENINPRVRIRGILPTLFDSRTLHGREAIEILKENFGAAGLRDRGAQDDQVRRSARAGLVGAQVRSQGQRCRGVPQPRSGGAEWQIGLACATVCPSCFAVPT